MLSPSLVGPVRGRTYSKFLGRGCMESRGNFACLFLLNSHLLVSVPRYNSLAKLRAITSQEMVYSFSPAPSSHSLDFLFAPVLWKFSATCLDVDLFHLLSRDPNPLVLNFFFYLFICGFTPLLSFCNLSFRCWTCLLRGTICDGQGPRLWSHSAASCYVILVCASISSSVKMGIIAPTPWCVVRITRGEVCHENSVQPWPHWVPYYIPVSQGKLPLEHGCGCLCPPPPMVEANEPQPPTPSAIPPLRRPEMSGLV